MRTARLHGPRQLRLADVDDPEVPPGHAAVRITAVGLCGSDLHWYLEGGIGDAQLDRPLVPGHELAGVVDLGDGTTRRVAIDPAIPCGTCPACRAGDANLCPQVGFAGHSRDGGLQEVLVWPRELLHPLPDQVDDVEGALLEPLGVALHALDLGHLRLGMRVLVVGCGPIGLLLIRLARLAGAASVVGVEPIAVRRDAAERAGADRAVAGTAELAAVTDRAAFDVAFEVTDDGRALDTALAAVRPGARVVLVGIPSDDRTSFTASLARRKGLTLVLSRRMHGTYPRAIDLVASKRVDVSSLVTHRFGLEQAAEAFDVAAARAGLKTIVHPDRPTV
jgi:L-iditol 2-dehydrogenase